MDKIDLIGVVGWVLIALAIVLLAAFLCWHFDNGWYVLVLFFLPGCKYSSDKKKADEDKEKEQLQA